MGMKLCVLNNVYYFEHVVVENVLTWEIVVKKREMRRMMLIGYEISEKETISQEGFVIEKNK